MRHPAIVADHGQRLPAAIARLAVHIGRAAAQHAAVAGGSDPHDADGAVAVGNIFAGAATGPFDLLAAQRRRIDALDAQARRGGRGDRAGGHLRTVIARHQDRTALRIAARRIIGEEIDDATAKLAEPVDAVARLARQGLHVAAVGVERQHAAVAQTHAVGRHQRRDIADEPRRGRPAAPRQLIGPAAGGEDRSGRCVAGEIGDVERGARPRRGANHREPLAVGGNADLPDVLTRTERACIDGPGPGLRAQGARPADRQRQHRHAAQHDTHTSSPQYLRPTPSPRCAAAG